MFDTRGRTKYKPVNYRNGLQEIKDSQAATLASINQDTAAVRYQTQQKTSQQDKMTKIITGGISGISNAMRQREQDDLAKRVSESKIKSEKQTRDFNASTEDSRLSTANSQADRSRIASEEDLSKQTNRIANQKSEIASAKENGMEFPEGVKTKEEQYAYIKSKEGQAATDLANKKTKQDIEHSKNVDKNLEANIDLGYARLDAMNKSGVAAGKAQDKINLSKHPDAPDKIIARYDEVKNNPTEIHIARNQTRAQKDRQNKREASYNRMSTRVDGHETSNRALETIADASGLRELIGADGLITREGQKIFDDFEGITGYLDSKFGDADKKLALNRIKAATQSFLQAAAQEGTFGALNFDREIRRAMSEAGADETTPPDDWLAIPGNMGLLAAEVMNSKVGISTLFARHADKTGYLKEEYKQLLTSGDIGTMNHRGLYKMGHSLLSLDKLIKGNDGYVEPNDFYDGKINKKTGKPYAQGQYMIDMIYGHEDSFKLTDNYSRNLADERFVVSSEYDKLISGRVLAAKNSGNYSEFFSSNSYTDYIGRATGTYANRTLPKTGEITADNGVGQSLDAATANPNRLTKISTTTNQTVGVTSPSGVVSVGATVKKKDSYDRARKNHMTASGYDEPDSVNTWDKNINDMFNSNPRLEQNGTSGEALAN